MISANHDAEFSQSGNSYTRQYSSSVEYLLTSYHSIFLHLMYLPYTWKCQFFIVMFMLGNLLYGFSGLFLNLNIRNNIINKIEFN